MNKIEKLTKLCHVSSGGTPSRGKKEFYGGNIPWAKIGDIERSNGIIYNTEEHITKEGLAAIRNRIFPKGTLLFSMYGSVGKTAFTGVDLSTNQAILGIRLKEEKKDKLDLRYLSKFFEYNIEVYKRRAVGGILKNLSATIVKDFDIPIPDINNQKRIAQLLTDCETLIAKREESIALLDELLKSTFLEMFGDPIQMSAKELEKFSTQLSFLTSGSRGWAKYYSETGAKFLRIQNLGFGILNEKEIQYVEPPESAESIRTKVQEGDLLISITADLGRTAVIPENYGDAHINQHLALIRLKKSLNPTYAAFYFTMPFGNRMIQKKDKDGVKSGLNFTDIRNFDVFIPELKEQEKFERIVVNVEETKNLFQTHLTELENLYGRLSQDAFKGELDLRKVPLREEFEK